MTKTLTAAFVLSIGLSAATGVLPVPAAAQGGYVGARPASSAHALPSADSAAGKSTKSGSAAVSNPDMRLWSFGECDKNFPYVDSAEHKECVRVVGSDEAKDARAFYFCDASHSKDPTEAKRCKEAYVENKSRATKEGFRANSADPAPAAASAATPPKRDQAEAIASLTRALKETDAEEAAAAAPAAAPAPETTIAAAPLPPSDASSGSSVMLGLAILLVLVGVGMRYLRRMTNADTQSATPRRSGSNPRTVSGSNPRPVAGGNPGTSGGNTRMVSLGGTRSVAGLPPRRY